MKRTMMRAGVTGIVFTLWLGSAAGAAWMDRGPGSADGWEGDPLPVVQWAVTQGGLTVALLACGWAWRREVIGRADDSKEREEQERERSFALLRIAEQCAAALRETAVAVARNTDAMHRVARVVENLDRRLERIEDQQ